MRKDNDYSMYVHGIINPGLIYCFVAPNVNSIDGWVIIR